MSRERKLYYLASPYSHEDASVKKHRAQASTEAAVMLLRHGIFTFAPISYNEPWEKYNLPGDWNFWCEFDKTFIERCDGGVIVLTLAGWQESVGVAAEIEFAKSRNLPIYFATLEQIEHGDLSFLNDQRAAECCRIFCEHSKL